MKYALFVIFEKATKFEIVVRCKMQVALNGLKVMDKKIFTILRLNNIYLDIWKKEKKLFG